MILKDRTGLQARIFRLATNLETVPQKDLTPFLSVSYITTAAKFARMKHLQGNCFAAILCCAWILVVLPMGQAVRCQEAKEGETVESTSEEGSSETADTPKQDEQPLYEREPYDIVYLDDVNQNAELIVEPLRSLDGRVPDPLPTSGVLEVTFVDQPQEVFDVEWSHIVKIELFESLIIKQGNHIVAQASQLARGQKYDEAQAKFDEAYWYFEYVSRRAPHNPRLNASVENFLMKNAAVSFSMGNYTDALSILGELENRNPTRRGLSASQRRVVDSVFKQFVKERSFRQAREILFRWKNSPDARWQEFVTTRQSQLTAVAERQIQQAEQFLSEQKYRPARQALQRAIDVAPEVPGAAEISRQLMEQYPVVTVGVSQPAMEGVAASLHRWSATRVARLLSRRLIEFDGPSAQGGDYTCPWGTLRTSDDGTSLQLNLRSASAETSALDTYIVTRRLFDLADPWSPNYQTTWASILNSIDVNDGLTLNVQLNNTFVKPEALLQASPLGWGKISGDVLVGPYRIGAKTQEETVFVSQVKFGLSKKSQPEQIIEKWIQGSVGVKLRLGEVDVVDRLNPIDVPQLREQEGIVVQRYDVPTVHVLLPNTQKNPFLAHVLFRKALVYGINRELILKQMILGGTELEGCQVLSGPFPAGFSQDDPLGYAYHPQIKPLPYHQAMARILSAVAVKSVTDHAVKSNIPVPELTPLVLAHADSEMARLACQVIADQLKTIEIPCELRPLPPGGSRLEDDIDLLYTEWSITEPVVDVGQIFGDGGLVKTSSAYLKHTVRQLNQISNWVEARELLNRIHQIVHHEATVIPLWQVTEHLAYHERLQGLEGSSVHLYQNVENWRVAAGP